MIIIIKIIIFWDQETLGWCPSGYSFISWGEGSSLALVGNLSRDSVSIKILVWRHLKSNPQLYEWIMSSNEIETNDVNGCRLTEQGLSSGRCSWQGNIGHHANPVISKRRKWTTQENKIVMVCYYWVSQGLEGIESACWVYGCKIVCFGYQNKD